MHKIDLNVARSQIGRNVNLHLKDGSVIVNVIITNAGRSLYGYEPKLGLVHFTASINKRIEKIPLQEIEWMEPISDFFLNERA